jgi:chemotaxis protein methyltransferase CheR
MFKELELSDQDFSAIAKIVHENLGIVLGEHKKNMVYRRLSKRIIELGMDTFGQYVTYLSNNDNEFSTLANAITTNLTSFFREGHHFEHLKDYIEEHIQRKNSLRIWSAGCSNGPEPYSIAMVLDSVLSGKGHYDAKILATDIDTNMLSEGSEGVYTEEWGMKIPSEYRKYAAVRDGKCIIDESLKNYISFKKLNLLHDWPISKKFDIIFCRNVVIYFDKPTQKIIFDKFADLTEDNGYLYIGHSENIMSVCKRFESCGKTIYRKIS